MDRKVRYNMAKSRVAPVKQKTLPRLELLAALLGARLSQYIIDILAPKFLESLDTIFWSDSQIVLSWLSSDKSLPQFVMARVRIIREITSPHTWKYCPSSSNPADLLTRGVSSKILMTEDQPWFCGPTWLRQGQREWPVWKRSINAEAPELCEYPKETACIAKVEEHPNILKVIKLERYSTLDRIIRVMALVVRFTETCKTRVKKTSPLTSKELRSAKHHLIKAVQQSVYSAESHYLSRRTPETKVPSIVRQLGLYLDEEGLIRCRGRGSLSFPGNYALHKRYT